MHFVLVLFSFRFFLWFQTKLISLLGKGADCFEFNWELNDYNFADKKKKQFLRIRNAVVYCHLINFNTW